MKCEICGTELNYGNTNCPNCGSPVSQYAVNNNLSMQGQEYSQQPINNQGYYGQQSGSQNYASQNSFPNGTYNQGFNQQYQQSCNMTKKQFLKLPEMKKYRNCIVFSSVLCYISSAITLIASIFLLDNIYGLIDVLLIFGIALGIHLKQSRVCAGILCGYSIINCIIYCIVFGEPNGWLIIIAGVNAVIGTFELDKQWKKYQSTSMAPYGNQRNF